MRIEKLHLMAFGPFTDSTIDLQPGLNVIYGPNEAGKSSMLRAIHALLFGVPSRTADNFLHAYPQLRVGGVLVKKNGERLECVRRKGNKATLRDQADDKKLDEAVLQNFLGAVNEDFFSSVFGIDHERLREGGEEVIRGEGRIGELLFAAGGVSHLRELQQKLTDETNSLYKPRAQQPSINAALSRLKTLRTEIRDLQVSSEDWAGHEAHRVQQQTLRDEIRRKLSDAEAAKERLQRIKSAWPTLAAWKERRQQFDLLADAVLLTENAGEVRSEAIQQLSVAQSSLQLAQDQRDALTAQIDSLHAPDNVLQYQEEVDACYKRLGSHEKDSKDRSTLDSRRRAASNNARQTLERLGWSMTLEEVAQQRLPDEKKVQIRALAKRHGELTLQIANAEKINARAERRLKEFEDLLAKTPELAEEQALSEALASAVAVADTADTIELRRAEISTLQREVESALLRLPIWNGTLEELCQLEVPLEATIDRFDQKERKIAARLTALRESINQNTGNTERQKEKLTEFEAGDSVPTELELSDARSQRDHGVQLVVETLDGRAPSPEAVSKFLKQSEQQGGLSSAIEPVIRKADVLVDRLRREADRVAQKSQLVAQLETLRSQALGLRQDVELAEADEQQHNQQWEQRWSAAGIIPLAPAEMRSWSRQHAELLVQARELTDKKAALEADESRCQSVRLALLSETTRCCPQDNLVDKTLSSLISAGQTHVADIGQQRAHRNQIAMDIKQAKEVRDESAEDLLAANKGFASWCNDWAEAVKILQLPAEALPEQAESVLTNLEQLFRELDEIESYRKRIWGIDKTAEEFVESAEELAKAIAPDLLGQEVEVLVKSLSTRAAEALRVDQQRASLIEQREKQESQANDAKALLTNTQAVLDALITEAGCKSADELGKAIEHSEQKRELQGQITGLEEQLTPFCAGMTLFDFQKDAETEEPDRLSSKITEYEELVAHLGNQRDEAITAIQRAASELKQYDGREAAAAKATERQYLLSQLEENAREYFVTKTADALLRRAVERYQQRAQGPVLRIAGERFGLLTNGAFIGLRSDLDESGRDVLVGARPDGRSTLGVEGMSEGARDQLYLALRIATLEHWFDQHESVPFVVDDILLSFDDARAEATLQMLFDLTKRTQVIFFTHHEHLVTLAQHVSKRIGLGDSLHIVTGWGNT